MSIASSSKTPHGWILLLAGAVSLVGCEQKVQPRQRAVGTAAKSKATSISFSVPDEDAFQLADGDASKLLASFWYTLEATDKDCDAKTRKETRDYAGAESVSVETIEDCDYELTLAIGKSKKAYYKTEEALSVTSGDEDVGVRLKRTDAGETAGFKAAWVEAGDDSDGGSDEGKTDEGSGDDGSDDAKVTYEDVKTKLSSSCTTCHAPGRSRSGSDLSTYTGAKGYGAQVVDLVSAGKMPPGNPLPAAEVELFKKWQTDGFLEKAEPIDQGDGDNGSDDSGGGDDRIVEFRIPKGTGNGAWNTAATPAKFKVGQTLRIYNDDTVIHQMHTNGAPCPHGDVIQPGAYGDCVASRAYSGSALYDHNTRGDFHLVVDP